MPSTQEFRRRIKSVNNTKQITKAMEMIASIKMQKAVKTIANARSYIQTAWNLLHMLAGRVLPENHILINPKNIGKTAVILITSDRGLCGAFNTDVLRRFVQFEKEECSCNGTTCGETTGNCDVIAIGKRGAEFVKRYKTADLIAEFKGFENNVLFDEVIPISKMTNGEYLNGKYDRVVIIYSHFVSSIKQSPIVKQILPITEDHISDPALWQEQETEADLDYKFEPDADKLFDSILKQIVRAQIYGSILETNASEHSARMVAMKNSTDNAKDLIDELTLLYNSIRQNNITGEIAEISSAAEAMK
jgi:F-type H+-transporting ATPase subunit gamma